MRECHFANLVTKPLLDRLNNSMQIKCYNKSLAEGVVSHMNGKNATDSSAGRRCRAVTHIIRGLRL